MLAQALILCKRLWQSWEQNLVWRSCLRHTSPMKTVTRSLITWEYCSPNISKKSKRGYSNAVSRIIKGAESSEELTRLWCTKEASLNLIRSQVRSIKNSQMWTRPKSQEIDFLKKVMGRLQITLLTFIWWKDQELSMLWLVREERLRTGSFQTSILS